MTLQKWAISRNFAKKKLKNEKKMKVMSFFRHTLPLIVKSTGLLKYNFKYVFVLIIIHIKVKNVT